MRPSARKKKVNAPRIAFDCSCLTEARTGVGTYTYQLLKHLVKLNGQNPSPRFQLTAFLSHKLTPSLPAPLPILREPHHKVLFLKSRSLDALVNTFTLPKLLREHSLFHATNYLFPPPLLKHPMKKVVTFYDLSTSLYPHCFPPKMLFRERERRASAENASLIITISESAKKDLAEHWKIPPEKIAVVYPGIDREWLAKREVSPRKLSSQAPYILYVGTLEPRKNLERLVEAFDKLSQKKLQLLLVGKKGWLTEPLFRKIEKLELKNRIHWLDYVSEEELLYLYRHALFLVYPSLYEGFGLPVLEAMACGCPVITSNVAALPEVVGNAALLVSPEKSSSIQEAMEQLVEDETLHRELQEKGVSRASAFSWEKAAEKTAFAYDRLLKGE